MNSVTEGTYSYNYLQFHWMRAQANLDRVQRVYANTITGRSVKLGEVKIGPFETDYFKQRVLPHLEIKRRAAFNEVNTAIFLYNLKENQENTAARKQTLRWIAEYLSRAKRFNEALIIPVADEDRFLLLGTILRVAATYGEDKVVTAILGTIETENKAQYFPTLAEALSFRGASADDLAAFRETYADTPQIREAQLRGVVRREIALARAAAAKLAPKNAIDGVDPVPKTDIRHDPHALAKALFPQPTPESAATLALFDAGTGRSPEAPQLTKIARPALEAARLTALADAGRWAELDQRAAASTEGRLRAIYLYAEAGKLAEADTRVAALSKDQPAATEAAQLERVRGQMFSNAVSFPVNPETFAALPIKDPNRVAALIIEWSLTPNRRQRGMLPWDAVIYKFAAGWDNLPLPDPNVTPVTPRT